MNHRDKFLAKFIHWQQIVRTWGGPQAGSS